MITTTQAQCAIGAAAAGSFRRAGRELFLSQAAVSDQIAKLERQLGATIFDRTSSGVLVTAEGRRIIPLLQAFVDSHDEILRVAMRPTADRDRVLRIVSHRPGVILTLPPVLAMLRSILGSMEVEVIPATSVPMSSELVRAGEAEIGLGYRNAGVANPDPQLEEVEIVTTPLVVFMSADHPLTSQDAVTLDDLAEQVIVQLRDQRSRDFTQHVVSGRPKPQIHTVADSQAALALVATGLGVAVLPEIFATLARPGVVERPLAEPAPLRAMTVLRLRGGTLSNAAEILWRLLRQQPVPG